MTLILLFISGFLFAESQIIKDFWNNNNTHRKPLFRKWNWWRSNNWHYENRIVQWIMRFPLAWFKDGYHFTKGLAISSIVVFAIFNQGLFTWYADFAIYSAIIGMSFNVRFHL